MPRLFLVLVYVHVLLTIGLILEIIFYFLFYLSFLFNIFLIIILSFPCIFFYCDMDPCGLMHIN